MSNYDDLKQRERHRHLLIVEGNHEKNELMKLLLKCFPEIDMKLDDIVIYETNIYMLYQNLEKMYPDGWYEQDVNLPLLVSKKKGIEPSLDAANFTTILLIFDYERHDPNYSEEKIVQMQEYFQDETSVGKLYLNYPMVESYQHLYQIPDEGYEERYVAASMTSGAEYKHMVSNTFIAGLINLPIKLGEILSDRFHVSDEEKCQRCVEDLLNLNEKETLLEKIGEILTGVVAEDSLMTAKFQMRATLEEKEHMNQGLTYYEYMKWLFRQIIIHNIKKANKVQNGVYEMELQDMKKQFFTLELEEILKKQNNASRDVQEGIIWILNTSVFFVPEYSYDLLDT